MDLQFHGANCLTITSKQIRVTIDDNLSELGATSVAKANDVTIFTTGDYTKPKQAPRLIISGPGEYEVGDVAIQGLAVRAHIDEPGQKSATLYKISVGDLRVVVTGHIYPELTDSELEAIGIVDVLCIPIGGNGYTLDGTGALKLIKKIEPKLIIPTHYAEAGIKYPVPQQKLEEALKELAMEPQETVTRLRLKPMDLAESSHLIIVERT